MCLLRTVSLIECTQRLGRHCSKEACIKSSGPYFNVNRNHKARVNRPLER